MSSLSTKSGSLLALKNRRAAGALFTWEKLVKTHFQSPEENTGKFKIEIQSIMMFLLVASQESPSNLTEISKSLDLDKMSITRNFYKLSGGHRDIVGLDLIQAVPDPLDYRRKLIQLTNKGRVVAYELTEGLTSTLSRINSDAV